MRRVCCWPAVDLAQLSDALCLHIAFVHASMFQNVLTQLCYIALLSATLTQVHGSMYVPVILFSDESACGEQVSKSSEP